jgi:GT2 family glycosyltransferase
MSDLMSVCIVNWNTKDDLRACLRALRAHPHAGGQEIVVVDNASDDGSAAMVRDEFAGAANLTLIANPFNANYARGTNQALAAARGELLLLLNPDALVTPGALDALAAFLRARPDAAAVAPRLVHEDGRTQHSMRGFPTPGALLWDVLGLARVFPGSRRFGAYRMPFFDYDRAGPAPQPMASCLLLTRKALEAVGPMDAARFPLFFNDVDWCLRAHRAGLAVYYTPDARVVHRGGASTSKIRTDAVRESHRALLRFYEKHYARPGAAGRAQRAVFRAAVALGAWARTGRRKRPLHDDHTDADADNAAPSQDLHRELERPGGPAGLPAKPARDGGEIGGGEPADAGALRDRGGR